MTGAMFALARLRRRFAVWGSAAVHLALGCPGPMTRSPIVRDGIDFVCACGATFWIAGEFIASLRCHRLRLSDFGLMHARMWRP